MSDTSATRSGPPAGDGEPRSLSFWERLRRWGGLTEGDDDSAPSLPEGAEPLDKHERALMQNVLRLRELSAWDVMVPRVDIIGLDATASFVELVALELAILRRDREQLLPRLCLSLRMYEANGKQVRKRDACFAQAIEHDHALMTVETPSLAAILPDEERRTEAVDEHRRCEPNRVILR